MQFCGGFKGNSVLREAAQKGKAVLREAFERQFCATRGRLKAKLCYEKPLKRNPVLRVLRAVF